MNKRNLARVIFMIVAAAALAQAQAPETASPDETTIRSEMRLVLVDAVATDKKNNFPRDLTQKDFRIWEDGKEQKITSFSLETAAVSAERPDKHYTILFFDTYAGGQLRERQETNRFLDGFASPDRYMSVVESSGADFRVLQNFSSDAEKLKKAVSQVQPGSRSAADATAGAVGGAGGRARAGAAPLNGGTFMYRGLLTALSDTCNSVAAIGGRKALILYSAGFAASSELTDVVTSATLACNKANVAVYAVIPGVSMAGGSGGGLFDASSGSSASVGGVRGGRGATAPAEMSDQPDPAMNALRTIAGETGGGELLTTGDLAASLGRIAQEQDSYYLLGYTPAVEAAEGTCHTLKVKVGRGGLEVRARKGYCTSRPSGLPDPKPVGKDLEAKAAAGNLTIQAKVELPWFYAMPYAAPTVAEVRLALDAMPSTMKLQKTNNRLHGEFNLEGVVSRADGSVAGRFNDIVKLDFDTQQQADAFLKTPYHYVSQFEVAPGQYTFRLIFASADQAYAKVDMPLNVAAWNGQTLSMSGIALSHDAHPFSGLQAGVDEAFLEGPRPLVVADNEIVPTGTNQFRAGERGYFYVELYEPRLAGAIAASLPAVGVRIRMLDRATGEQKTDSGVVSAANLMHQGKPVIPFAGTLPSDLPAGAYTMEVSAVRENGQDAVVRTVNFDVN